VFANLNILIRFKNFFKEREFRILNIFIFFNGCETWSLTLREENKLRLFENRVLRRIFWPKSYEVTERWRQSHNEELHNLYSSQSTIRIIKSSRMRWAGHLARMG
jgi:hypothetical protein